MIEIIKYSLNYLFPLYIRSLEKLTRTLPTICRINELIIREVLSETHTNDNGIATEVPAYFAPTISIQ